VVYSCVHSRTYDSLEIYCLSRRKSNKNLWHQVNSKVQIKVNEALCEKMEEILPEKLAEQVRRHHDIYIKIHEITVFVILQCKYPPNYALLSSFKLLLNALSLIFITLLPPVLLRSGHCFDGGRIS